MGCLVRCLPAYSASVRRNMAASGMYYARRLQLAAAAGDTDTVAQLRRQALAGAVTLHEAHSGLFESVTKFEKVSFGPTCS